MLKYTCNHWFWTPPTLNANPTTYHSTSIVRSGDSVEPLLTCCIPTQRTYLMIARIMWCGNSGGRPNCREDCRLLEYQCEFYMQFRIELAMPTSLQSAVPLEGRAWSRELYGLIRLSMVIARFQLQIHWSHIPGWDKALNACMLLFGLQSSKTEPGPVVAAAAWTKGVW